LGEVVKSAGACEKCGQMANCIDCHVGAHQKKKADAAPICCNEAGIGPVGGTGCCQR
jgi:hypothetical protein